MPVSAWPFAIGEALLEKTWPGPPWALPGPYLLLSDGTPPSLLPAFPPEAICSGHGLLWLPFSQSFQNLPCVISTHSALPPRFLCSSCPPPSCL